MYDGNSESDEQIAVICGSYVQYPIYSSGRKLLVTFATDETETGTGFKAVASFVAEVPPGRPFPKIRLEDCMRPGIFKRDQRPLPSKVTLRLKFDFLSLHQTYN